MTWCVAVGEFARDVRAFTGATSRELEAIVRKIALEMFSRIILRSPVDTGRFRANWQVAIGSVPTGTLELEDKTGTATISKVQAATLSLNAGERITFVNNLPYAQRLEDGYSTQAPRGMVMLTVQDFQRVAAQMGVNLVRL